MYWLIFFILTVYCDCYDAQHQNDTKCAQTTGQLLIVMTSTAWSLVNRDVYRTEIYCFTYFTFIAWMNECHYYLLVIKSCIHFQRKKSEKISIIFNLALLKSHIGSKMHMYTLFFKVNNFLPINNPVLNRYFYKW